jgi:ethanolaminephosphotransferase
MSAMIDPMSDPMSPPRLAGMRRSSNMHVLDNLSVSPPGSQTVPYAAPYYYLSPAASEALPKFQYNGTDLSPIYKHILSPMAQYFVDHWTPTWVAPNAITLFGLVWMLVSYGLLWYYYPNMDEGAPGGDSESAPPLWPFAFASVAILIYQTLDNMDGKQSRKTGSSSPLGLLFDHGIDSINSIFGSANMICAMGFYPAADQWQIWVIVLGPMAAFYITTWEEYYTGELLLPFANGPTEGLLIAAASYASTAYLGVEYFHETDWYDYFFGPYFVDQLPENIADSILPRDGSLPRNCDIVAVIFILGIGRELVYRTVWMANSYGSSSLIEVLPMALLCASPLLLGMGSDETGGVLSRCPRTCLHLISALFVEAVTQLMLDSMTTGVFRGLRPCQVPLIILTILLWAGLGPAPATLDNLILAYAAGMTAFLAMKFRVIVHEICDLLKIYCFDIVTPHTKKKLAKLE